MASRECAARRQETLTAIACLPPDAPIGAPLDPRATRSGEPGSGSVVLTSVFFVHLKRYD